MGAELDEGHGEGGAGSICGLCRFGVCGKDAENGGYSGRAFFFLTEKNANYRQALDQQLALKKQALSPVLEISDTAFIIRMLEKNHGLSFLPYLAVERDIRKGRIALLHVEDVEISMYRQIFYHKNKFKTREMEEFIRLAAE